MIGAMDAERSPVFTIFIPTYNRAGLLPRALESLENQTFRDFDVLVVDDGSSDGTREVVENWSRKVDIPVRYFWKSNGGKPSAHNYALDKIRGLFTVTLDSDDILAPEALSIFHRTWEEIPFEERPGFAGVEGLCAFLRGGGIQGDPFPRPVMDSNYLEIAHRYRVSGDKKNAIRTEVLREFPFPCQAGEKDMRESVIMARMAHSYKFRYVNQIVQYIEQFPDGLTAHPFRRRMRSPRSFRLAFQEMVNEHAVYCSRKELYRFAVRYVRYSLHSGISFREQGRDIRNRWLWRLALPEGVFSWLKDSLKIRRKMLEKE